MQDTPLPGKPGLYLQLALDEQQQQDDEDDDGEDEGSGSSNDLYLIPAAGSAGVQ